MMPSHDTSLISHSAFNCSQSARIRSGSKPVNCPVGVLTRNGGYGSAATPKRRVSAAALAGAVKEHNVMPIEASNVKLRNIRFMVDPYFYEDGCT
ncbi:hypothetical protein D3C72_282960 [compost metagenome]